MPYFPITAEDEKIMLQEIGVKSFDELLNQIPKNLLYPDIRLPQAIGEMSLKREIEELSQTNRHTQNTLSFLGAGIYEHFIPSAVDPIVSRGEFLTAYTPYQAEASQGTLQAIYEYQTFICRLTGMDVSNASHYDGATALAEAVALCLHSSGRTKVLVPKSLHPQYREVLKTYLAGIPSEIIEVPFTKEGLLDRKVFSQHLSSETACAVLPYPNFFGLVEDYSDVVQMIHEQGALAIAVSNPMSLSFYKAPREWGADIVCGEAQPLGIPMSLGGPTLGYFAVTKALMRRIPGRIAGVTQDVKGRRAFVLTIQAREQHIRREKATSNICSNQALMALRATVYLALLGEKGFKRVGEMNVANASYLKEKISRISNFSLVFSGPSFNEFVVRYKGDVAELFRKLEAKGILGGVSLAQYYPELENSFLVCATETKTREDLDRFAKALEEVSR